MSSFSAAITLATGVVLPTFDVYSDIAFAINMLMWTPGPLSVLLRDVLPHLQVHHGHPEGTNASYCTGQRLEQQLVTNKKYAAAMLIPPIISWLFVAYQWFRNEVGTKRKTMTLPFLLLQVYPQWRALRVLYYGKWKKQRGWQRMKDEWETEICSLGESPYENENVPS